MRHPPVTPPADHPAASFPTAYLAIFLRLVGCFALLAFIAAFMPATWIVQITNELGLASFPDAPVSFYLARHLSLMYGFVGVALVIFAGQLDRYRPLVAYLAAGVIAFGVLQAAIDLQSEMPIWWTVSESTSTVIGGCLIRWLDRRCESAPVSDTARG